ncbi:unnamed protein product, partial [marine sediment metagenome]
MAMQFDYAAEIWKARPKPFTAAFSKSTAKGGMWGASIGAAVGGAPGAVAGAGLGAIFGTLSNSVSKVIKNMEMLEKSTRKLVDHYKDFSPIISRLNHQWRLLDRNINRMWAKTLAPLMKQLTVIGTNFREQWEKIKTDIFKAIEPFLKQILSVFSVTVDGVLALFRGLAKVLTT